MKDNKYTLNYFDRRVPEEDLPITVNEETQKKYEELDILFEEFFDDDSLHLAKVIFRLICSNHRKMKEIRKV
jgi:hypothetical protein